MIGLLGTVTGMISVFDVMAVQGTSNARLMAAGISMATMQLWLVWSRHCPGCSLALVWTPR